MKKPEVMKCLVAAVLFVVVAFTVGHQHGLSTQHSRMMNALGIKEFMFRTRLSDGKTHLVYITRKGEKIVVDY